MSKIAATKLSHTKVLSRIFQGVKDTVEIIQSTLGPTGYTVTIAEDDNDIRMTKDGALVAKTLERLKGENQLENLGRRLVCDLSKKTADVVGDGSTTVCVLFEALFKHALEAIHGSYSLAEINTTLDVLREYALLYIDSKKKQLQVNAIKKVAKIATNHDTELSEQIHRIFQSCGEQRNYAHILVKQSMDSSTFHEHKKGFYFERGIISTSFFKEDERRKMECSLDNPYVIILKNKQDSIMPLHSLILEARNQGKSLVIIATDFSQDLLRVLALTRVHTAHTNVLCVKAAGFGNTAENFLKDLAVFVDSNIFDSSINNKILLKDLKTVKQIVITKNDTTILTEAQDRTKINAHVAALSNELTTETSSYNQKQIKERIARLNGSIGMLFVGGITEAEIKERTDRAEDAIRACQEALKSGIVNGGGTTFFYMRQAIKKLTLKELKESIDNCFTLKERHLSLLKDIAKALCAPIKTLIQNSSRSEENVLILDQLLKKNNENYGYNGKLNTICDISYGTEHENTVIGPVSIAKFILTRTVSVVKQCINNKAVIYTDNTKKD